MKRNRISFMILLASFLIIELSLVSSIEIPPVPTPPKPLIYEEKEDEVPEKTTENGAEGVKDSDKEGVKEKSKEEKRIVRRQEADSLADFSIDKIIIYLEPLVRAESENQIVLLLKNLSLEKVQEVLGYILKSSLPRNSKIQIILGVSLYYQNNKDEQNAILSLLDSDSEFSEGPPLLSVVTSGIYPEKIIVDLLALKKDQKKQMIDDALVYAIKTDNLEQFKFINQYANNLDAQEATRFLWVAIDANAPIEFVDYFIENGANIDQEKDEKDPLIAAVQNLNKPVVQTLIKAAQKDPKIDLSKMINRFVSVYVGTPLQAALGIQRDEKRSTEDKKMAIEIEELLRSSGATENK